MKKVLPPHQLPCPYTPKQNGIAERKHRHINITESGLSMMFATRTEAFQVAVFMLNRKPFHKLDNLMPDYSWLRSLLNSIV